MPLVLVLSPWRVVAGAFTVEVLNKGWEEIRPGSVSVMPAGLDQQLTIQEIADLLAFLKACK